MEEHDNPYAAPQSASLEPSESGESGRLADRSQRLAAPMLDGLIMVVICYPILLFLLYPALFGSSGFPGLQAVARDHQGISGTIELGIINTLLFLAIFLLVNLHLLLKHGQTVGKRTVGIRIDGGAGPGLTLAQVTRRYGFMYGLGLVPVIGGLLNLVNILCIFRSSRHGLHDDIAGTVVIKT